MRFKIGDVVSVRSDIDKFRYVDGIFLFKSMRKQRGRVERIIGAVDEGEQGFYKINGSGFWWPGAMLNEVDMTEFNTPAHYILEDGSDSMDVVAKILGREQFKGFLRGNALKYLIRYEQKGGIDDLKKAPDYVKRLMVIEDFEDDRRLREDRYKYGTSVSKDRFAESLKKFFRDNKMDFRKLYVLYDCGSKKVLCASYSNLDIYAELGKSQKNDGYHGKMHVIEVDLDEVQAK